MAVVEAPNREAVGARDEELLIREARQRARRRRWFIGLALLIVIATALVIVGGGKRIPPKATTTPPPSPSRAGLSGGHNEPTPALLGGQSVQSLWPFGGETSWVYTMNVNSPTDQGIEWTSNGGRTWLDATPAGYRISGGQYSLGNFFALSARRAWVVAGRTSTSSQPAPRLLTTDNGGRSWSVAGTVPLVPCTLSFTSTIVGTCASSDGAGGSAGLTLFATHNGGRSWSKIFDNTTGFSSGSLGADVGLPFMCDKTISTTGHIVWAEFWCNASSANLFRSDDAGRTWSKVALTQPSPVLPGGAEFTGPVILSGQRGAVAFVEGQTSFVYVTRDGGHSFALVDLPRAPHPWTVDVVSPTVWRLAYRNQILFTNNAGSSWSGLSDNAFSNSTIQRTQRFSSGAPATLNFTTPSFGWMSWFTGNGFIVMSTRDGGRTWHRVAVPGTGARHV